MSRGASSLLPERSEHRKAAAEEWRANDRAEVRGRENGARYALVRDEARRTSTMLSVIRGERVSYGLSPISQP